MGTPWGNDIVTQVGVELGTALAQHASAPNPHNIDPAEIGAAVEGHTHPGGGGVTGGVMRKTATQTMTLTSQTAITDLSFAVAASSSYYFDIFIAVTTSSGTSPTTSYGFTGPAGSTVGITRQQQISATGWSTDALSSFANFSAVAQVANSMARFQGVIVTGGTAGTVQLTCARGGTNPSMVINAGSNGHWIKVA